MSFKHRETSSGQESQRARSHLLTKSGTTAQVAGAGAPRGGEGRRGRGITSENLSCSVQMFGTEKAMAPHCSTLAWKIPWMEEPGGLQSMGL